MLAGNVKAIGIAVKNNKTIGRNTELSGRMRPLVQQFRGAIHNIITHVVIMFTIS